MAEDNTRSSRRPGEPGASVSPGSGQDEVSTTQATIDAEPSASIVASPDVRITRPIGAPLPSDVRMTRPVDAPLPSDGTGANPNARPPESLGALPTESFVPAEDGSSATARTEDLAGPGLVGPAAAARSSAHPARPRYSGRYDDIRLLGSGGFGEVRKVFDRRLGRTVAMKILHPEIDDAASIRARFLSEIRLGARLQHPGVVAVHDWGEMDDGRLWFTMQEVRGRTLRKVIAETFARANDASQSGGPGDAPPGGQKDGHEPGEDPEVARRRLVDAFSRVCETMAYVHSRGVIHRDLKPDNVMIGAFGQVMVMDWGIARRFDTPDDEPDLRMSRRDTGPDDSLVALNTPVHTQHGDVMGTPAYMAPEQARGDIALHGPATDVYALGAILFHMLTGRPPYTGGGREAWQQVLAGDRPSVTEAAPPGWAVPFELAAICEAALAAAPDDRHSDAGELSREVAGWLDGAKRRARALSRLARANERAPTLAALRAEAGSLRAEAKKLLSDIRPSDPVAVKQPVWALEDRAEELEREAALGETEWLQEVHGALAMAPGLAEAHGALADHYCARLLAAEADRRATDTARLEVLLRAHDRGEHAAILSGRGALTLITEPAGARVALYRHERHQRRLVARPLGHIGPTPIVEHMLEKGSYLLVITAPGHAPTRYPVVIERGGHWHGCAPGQSEPWPVPLPVAGALSDGEIFVPPGWTWTGGDPDAPDCLPRTRVWIDGVIIGRFPVTNREYIAFLDDLVTRGRDDEAIAACPHRNVGTVDALGDERLSYRRDERGRFVLRDDDPAEVWRPSTPVVLIDWHSAMAFARWLSSTTGTGYRLPGDLEREKASRGVDGRFFPWGNHFDATWACTLASHTGEPGRVDVDDYPMDESPYGMRGGAGNSRDWCINTWTHEGPTIVDGRLMIEPAAADDNEYRAIRGGAWSSVANHSRVCARFANRPGDRRSVTGLRVARPFPAQPSSPHTTDSTG